MMIMNDNDYNNDTDNDWRNDSETVQGWRDAFAQSEIVELARVFC